MSDNVKSTSDYTAFRTLMDNRQTAKNHINKLKLAIEKNPRILEVQPILVNENMEIIDGQHRFAAASELGLPIHYTVVKGLTIDDARRMNVLQRRWTLEDYAVSYAKAGNVNYKAYNAYRRDNPSISSTIVIIILAGGEKENINIAFRNGEFTINRDVEDIEWIFDKLKRIQDYTSGEIPLSKSFVSALLQAIDRGDFNVEDFLINLKKNPEMFHRVSTVRDGLRMIEDIYNYRKSVNLIRLY